MRPGAIVMQHDLRAAIRIDDGNRDLESILAALLERNGGRVVRGFIRDIALCRIRLLRVNGVRHASG